MDQSQSPPEGRSDADATSGPAVGSSAGESFGPAAGPAAALRSAAGLVASWSALAGLTWWMVWPGNPFRLATMIGTLVSWVVLAAAVRCLGRLRRAAVGPVIVVGGLLLGLLALSAPPSTSNDAARYAWDGIVQKAGVSPYSFVPIDETLSTLRPSWLFAAGITDAAGRPRCGPGLFATDSVAASGYPSGEPLCTAINRPQSPTIYPPAAELYFVAVRSVVANDVGHVALQVAGLVLCTAVGLGLLRLLAGHGLPAHYAAVWSWSPLVLLEAVNNAHVDALAAALLLTAGALLVTRRPLRSGAAFGAAVATKLVPAIAAPALLFRRPWRFVAAAVATFLLLYVPYVAVAGPAVIGYLPGYLAEEGYDDGGSLRFALARMLTGASILAAPATATAAGADGVPGSGVGLLAGLLPVLLTVATLAAVAVRLIRTTTESTIWERQTLMIGLTLLFVSPGYPWYALLLLPWLVMSRRWEYVGVILALGCLYMLPSGTLAGDTAQRAALAAAALAIAAAHWLRRRREVVAAATEPLPEPSGDSTAVE